MPMMIFGLASAAVSRNRPIHVRSALAAALLLLSVHPATAADRLKEPRFLPIEKLIADYGEAMLPNNPADETQKLPTSKRKAKVASVQRRFLAVRGVFPLRKEAEEYRTALEMETLNDAAEITQIVDFKLERQLVPEGKADSAEPWAELDIKSALQILDAAGDLADDVVGIEFIDNTITMPLPARASGKWSGDLAGHPALKGFKPWPVPREVRKATDGTDLDPLRLMDYLLFRFLDFSVEPGVTYRYRVKLEFENPNYELDENDPASKGKTRWSAWSEPSPAVKAAKAAPGKPAAPKSARSSK